MKKLILAFILLGFCSLPVIAAKYTVNSKGVVKSSTGKIQNTQNIPSSKNFYNNFQASTYVNTKQATVNNIDTIDIILDCSGSMENWIHIAKQSMAAIISQLPKTTKVGFRIFGFYGDLKDKPTIVGKVSEVVKKGDGKYKVRAESTMPYLGSTGGFCSATSQLVKVNTYNPYEFTNAMNRITIGGATPITYALYLAVKQDFMGLSQDYPKKIILITDGEESCGGDPCTFAKQLMKERQDIVIDVVLVSPLALAFPCVAKETGGKVYYPSGAFEFVNSITQSIKAPAPVRQLQKDVKEEPQQNFEYIKN